MDICRLDEMPCSGVPQSLVEFQNQEIKSNSSVGLRVMEVLGGLWMIRIDYFWFSRHVPKG